MAEKADNHKGEVMIFELAQMVEGFLHANNHAPRGSFYEEMLETRMKQEQDLRKTNDQEAEKRRRILEGQVQKRKQQLTRTRRDTSKATSSETSSSHESISSTISDESNSSPSQNQTISCSEHLSSEVIFFPSVERKVQKGGCLSHSQKGCITYSGIDLQTGQLLYITEWNIKNTVLQQDNISPDGVIECKLSFNFY